MGKAYITEYQRLPVQQGLPIQAGYEPGLRNASSPVTFSTAASSATFDAQTVAVRIHVDAICSYSFGSSPTATTSDARMPADHTEIFGVNPGDKVSFVSNT